jgi:hypothetical protein
MNQTLMSKPFFAQFLENQKTQDQTENGFPWPIITDKLRDAPMETQKFPSDGDEEAGI